MTLPKRLEPTEAGLNNKGRGPREDAVKKEVVASDFGDDVYARAWVAMAQLQGKDLAKVPYVTIESTLGLVSTALGVLATYWPVLEAVRAAVDFTKTVIVTKENIRKRIAGLRLMQADMLCSLFSLRDFKSEDLTLKGQTLPGRLEVLCGGIKDDIKRLGNVMENYVTENWLGRILKDKGWKDAVAKCGEIVERRKKEIIEVMTVYAARRTDQVLESMDRTLAPQLANIAIEVKALQELFQPSPDEIRAQKEVERLGGPDACLDSEAKLNDLVSFIPPDEDAGKRGPKSREKNAGLSAAELRRIRTPVEELLQRNLARFESKIDYLVDKARREHQTMRLIKKLAGARPYERIENPDIRKLWKEMGWSGSVDSRTFVLNLYDFFIDLERESRTSQGTGLLAPEGDHRTPHSAAMLSPTVVLDSVPPRSLSPAPSEAGSEEHDEFEGCTTPEAAASDAWCLNYFNYRTLSTFIEVLDDDMNGLIKIKEVNEFTSSIPEGITLMQWIVYCAYGWVVSTHLYRIRIWSLIERMIATDYAKENSEVITAYINILHWVVAFLWPLAEPDFMDDQQLLKVAHIVMEKQEQALHGVLEMLHYELEEEDLRSMMDLNVRAAVKTIGRIEDRIFPILFLVMRRHTTVFALSTVYILEENALERAARTVDCITDLLVSRAVYLREHFTKLQYDLNRKMQYFANGMFQEMNKLIAASHDDRIGASIVQTWCLPWRQQSWLAWALQEYDLECSLETPSMGLVARASLLNTLVRVAASSPDEADEGYELVASYRRQYHIQIVYPAITHDARLSEQAEREIKPEPPSVLAEHSGILCDGCRMDPVMGIRFKCIDCRDIDYCVTCHSKSPASLQHSSPLVDQHDSSHRFLRLEVDTPREVLRTVIGSLRTAAFDDTAVVAARHELPCLNPVFEHCLSAAESSVQDILDVFSAYRRLCLEAEFDNDAMELAHLEALDSIFTRFSGLPTAAELAKSKGPLFLRMRDDFVFLHAGYYCNGGDDCKSDMKVRGERYRCVDCIDFDYCSQCFAEEEAAHEGGKHHFVLLRYPTGQFTQARVLSAFKTLVDSMDPWTIQIPVRERADGPSGDEFCKQITKGEDGAAPQDLQLGLQDCPRPDDSSDLRCRGPCHRPLSEGRAYRCLVCAGPPPDHDESGYLLCPDCAFKKVSWDDHKPTHILAIIAVRPPAPLTDSGHVCGAPEAVAQTGCSNEDLSKRMDKIEEQMTTLLSMFGKLQDIILASTAGRSAGRLESPLPAHEESECAPTDG
ncbi:hypothetical protein BV20DRAFT_1122765 [Pilatotrama ljubarskyi]|nr:hypothetical protein BV20DRAFT_1122765 [Pilatotrama ljubarskyi]